MQRNRAARRQTIRYAQSDCVALTPSQQRRGHLSVDHGPNSPALAPWRECRRFMRGTRNRSNFVMRISDPLVAETAETRQLHPRATSRSATWLRARACMGTGTCPTCCSCDADRPKTRCPRAGYPCRPLSLHAPGNPPSEFPPRLPRVRGLNAMTAPDVDSWSTSAGGTGCGIPSANSPNIRRQGRGATAGWCLQTVEIHELRQGIVKLFDR